MNLEKFIQSPYRALVMAFITIFLVFFGIELVKFIISIASEESKRNMWTETPWLVPVIASAYIWWSAVIVSAVMVVLPRPLKPYKEKGLIAGLVFGFIISTSFTLFASVVIFIANHTGGSIVGLFFSLIGGSIVGLFLGLICGFAGEFTKPEN